MSTPTFLNYINGPAFLLRNGVALYSQQGFKLDWKSKSGKVDSDLHGKEIDEYLVSRTGKISFRPVDALANLTSIFSLGIGGIGQSIFTGAARTITGISLANPGVVTFASAHNLGPAGTTIVGTISGVGGSVAPSTVNGAVTLTVIDGTTASCGINVTHAGTGGSFTPISEPLQIVCQNGELYWFERAGQTKAPTVKFAAGKGFFAGDLEYTVLGSLSRAQTDAAYFASLLTKSFSDTTFDQTLIKRYQYTALFGTSAAISGNSTTLGAINAQEGFDLAIDYKTAEIPDDNVGIGDIILEAVTAGVKFIPSNLTAAQILNSLANLEGSGALLPGQSFAGAGGNNLQISGTDGVNSMTFTLLGAGFMDAMQQFATGKLRAGEVAAMSKRTWSGGTAASLYSFATT